MAPCPIRVVVVRMLRNLKAIYGKLQDVSSLLPVQRRLAAISQDEPNELRDLGLLCAQTNRLGEALDPLQAYLGDALRRPMMSARSRPWSKPSAGKSAGGIEPHTPSVNRDQEICPNSRTTSALRLKNQRRTWPINGDTALAERERAGGDDWATGSASWVMWGSDQDDRSFRASLTSENRAAPSRSGGGYRDMRITRSTFCLLTLLCTLAGCSQTGGVRPSASVRT